jgi:hypothetical protein
MTKTLSDRNRPLDLRAGDWIEVRSREEILATLDDRGCFENLPFMPEMLQFCGQRFRVFKRSDKTCDPAHAPWSIRRMKNSVHLEGVRCVGEYHGGCQAGCLIWWNEAWLKRADNSEIRSDCLRNTGAQPAASDGSRTMERVFAATQTINPGGETVYSCQATEIRSFSTFMAWWDPRQYIRDFRSGNLDTGHSRGSKSEHILDLALVMLQVVGVFLISFFTERRLLNYPSVAGTIVKTPVETLDLQAGELVQVRSKEEIIATLDKRKQNRGLLFDGEMLPYCGGIYRVLRRVHRIIDENSGKMRNMKYPCIILEGVACRSNYHRLCPRAIYHYWRENWLVRVSAVPPLISTGQVKESCEKA